VLGDKRFKEIFRTVETLAYRKIGACDGFFEDLLVGLGFANLGREQHERGLEQAEIEVGRQQIDNGLTIRQVTRVGDDTQAKVLEVQRAQERLPAVRHTSPDPIFGAFVIGGDDPAEPHNGYPTTYLTHLLTHLREEEALGPIPPRHSTPPGARMREQGAGRAPARGAGGRWHGGSRGRARAGAAQRDLDRECRGAAGGGSLASAIDRRIAHCFAGIHEAAQEMRAIQPATHRSAGRPLA
jgi:hypothetical protein